MFKRGDKVRITSIDLFDGDLLGQIVTVDYVDDEFIHVTDPDGEPDYGYIHEVEAIVQQAPTGNPKYNREIKPGVFVDVYDVLYAFKVTDPCLQHAIKKALAAGQRGHKDTRQDLVDIRDSSQRALDSFDMWEAK